MRVDLTVNEISEYKYEFLKAFWTHRMKDRSFDSQVLETQKICNIINSIIQQLAIIEGFNKDPYDMTQAEFEEFYEAIKRNFLSEREERKHNRVG